jgi:nicotinamidase-related amidase
VVVFGISTDMCVSTKIRVGANLGWRMMLVEDACDCFDLRLVCSPETIPV